MKNRMMLLLAGLAMSASATGCCCLGGCLGGYNRCNPCGTCYPQSPCGPGGCAPTYGYPAGPTGYLGSDATAFAPTTTISSTAILPPAYPVTTTVMAPTLPTY